MGSEMTKRNIQTELHRFEGLKTGSHKVNHFQTVFIHVCIAAHTHTHKHTRTRTHTHIRPSGSGFVCSLEVWGFQFISQR